jgi:hypothetical protein
MVATSKMKPVNLGAKTQMVIPLRLRALLKQAPGGTALKEEMSVYKSEEIALEESKYTKCTGVRNSNLSKKKRGLGKAEL